MAGSKKMNANRKKMVIWITGLSGAGKTTLARSLLPLLPEPRLLLDGDEMRSALSLLASGYDAQSRRNLAFTYARLCALTAEQGQKVICATISMFHEVRAWNRENLPGYFEVFLEAPQDLRKARDYKKVYDPQKNAEPVVGIDLKPELPLNPDLRILQDGRAPDEMARNIIECMEKKKLLT